MGTSGLVFLVYLVCLVYLVYLVAWLTDPPHASGITHHARRIHYSYVLTHHASRRNIGPLLVLFDPCLEDIRSTMLIPRPMPLHRQSQPFDDRNWIYEIMHGGIRALAVIERGTCRLLSDTRYKINGFRDIRLAIVHETNAVEAVLDGELATADLTAGIKTARYYAFDLVWLNGQDLRAQPLLSRKEQLRLILPTRSAHVLYADHARGAGHRLYRLACEMDQEGILAKRADSPYEPHDGPACWLTIINPAYSRKQRQGRLLKRSA